MFRNCGNNHVFHWLLSSISSPAPIFILAILKSTWRQPSYISNQKSEPNKNITKLTVYHTKVCLLIQSIQTMSKNLQPVKEQVSISVHNTRIIRLSYQWIQGLTGYVWNQTMFFRLQDIVWRQSLFRCVPRCRSSWAALRYNDDTWRKAMTDERLTWWTETAWVPDCFCTGYISRSHSYVMMSNSVNTVGFPYREIKSKITKTTFQLLSICGRRTCESQWISTCS